MKRFAALWVAVSLLMGSSVAMAHSTQGRKKILLKSDHPTVEEVSYYVESYVNRKMLAKEFPDSDNRFISEEVLRVVPVIEHHGDHDHHGEEIEVITRILDKKTRKRFERAIVLERSENGVWVNEAHGDEAVHTYVNRTWYNYTHYFLPLLGIAVFLSLLGWGYDRLKKGGFRRPATETAE